MKKYLVIKGEYNNKSKNANYKSLAKKLFI